LLAVDVDSADGSGLGSLSEEDAGDRADDFEFFDKSGGRDVLAELGDGGEDAVVGGLVEEDGIVSLLFNFSLGPFLNEGRVTLAPPLACWAALAMESLLFFCPATGCFPMWL
jgi:hypothetical protein